MLTTISPINGWMLDCIAVLDYHLTGFAGAYIRAGSERRQVIAAYLAIKKIDFDQPDLVRECAERLIHADHRTILIEAFGSIPVGFRGALRRSGPQPHRPRFYTLLHEMLTSPSHARIVPTILQSTSLDLDRLRIIRKLPVEACTAVIAAAIENRRTADDFAALVGLLLDSGLDCDALVGAFHHVVGKRSLVKMVRRWSLKLVLPAHPVPASDTYLPITTAADLKRLGGRYRNCAASYLAGALDGIDAFAEFMPDKSGKRGVVVHLRRRDDRFVVEGMFGLDNARPNAELRCGALNYLERYGVVEPLRSNTPRGPWAALTRFLSPMLFHEQEDDY